MSSYPLTLREDSDRVLLAVACGRTITIPQLQEIMEMSYRTARKRLIALADIGLVDRVQKLGSPGQHLWFLTPAGAGAVALISTMEVKAPKPAEVQSVLQSHAVATTDAVVALMRTGRLQGDLVGPTWRIEEQVRYGQTRRELLRVDALLSYGLTIGRDLHSATLALEIDRGTETVEILAEKAVLYARAQSYVAPGTEGELWRERWPRFPRLVIVLAHAGRTGQAQPAVLQQRLRAVANRILSDPQAGPALESGRLSAAICTLADLQADGGAYAPILRTLTRTRIREPETIAQFIAPDVAPPTAAAAAMAAQPTPTLPGLSVVDGEAQRGGG